MPDRNKHFPIDRRLRSNLQSLIEQAENLSAYEFVRMPELAKMLDSVLHDEPVFLIKPKA